MFKITFKLTNTLFAINIIAILLTAITVSFKGLFLPSFFLLFILAPAIIINAKNKFAAFFFLYVNIFYIQRILIIALRPTEFWYDSHFLTDQAFREAIIYLSIFFGTSGFVLKFLDILNEKKSSIALDETDKKIFTFFLSLYLTTTLLISLTGQVIIGYVIPEALRIPIRLLQFIAPLGILVFAAIFPKGKKIFFIILLVLISYFSGSKAIIYNLLLSLIICKIIFDDENLGLLPIIFFFAIITAPLMFLTTNYVRYPEDVGNISLMNYILRDYSLSIYSEVSHRFANFDTLVAFLTKSNLMNYKIHAEEYFLEIVGAINRFVPGDILDITHSYIPFEEKSAFELRGIIISKLEGIGRHTESLALARYYFLGPFLGTILFIFFISAAYLLSTSKNLILNSFAYLYVLDILSGGDLQSLIVLPLNIIVLIIIFVFTKFLYKNFMKPFTVIPA